MLSRIPKLLYVENIRLNNNFLFLLDLSQQVTLDVPTTGRNGDNKEELNGNTDAKRRLLTISPPVVKHNDIDNTSDSCKQVGKNIRCNPKY